MKKVLMLIVWLGLGWSLLTLLSLSSQRAALQQDARNMQRKYDALKTLYDQTKEETSAADAAWQEKMQALTGEQDALTRENTALRQENEAIRRESASLALAQDRARTDWERKMQALTAQRDQAEKQLSDVMDLLMPAARETAAEEQREDALFASEPDVSSPSVEKAAGKNAPPQE